MKIARNWWREAEWPVQRGGQEEPKHCLVNERSTRKIKRPEFDGEIGGCYNEKNGNQKGIYWEQREHTTCSIFMGANRKKKGNIVVFLYIDVKTEIPDWIFVFYTFKIHKI